MREQSWDLLEKYIASGDTEARQDEELATLCDLADEIRALNPHMPPDVFAEQLTNEIAAQIPVRREKRGLALIRLKPAGWASVCVAAALMITLGVLPSKPSDTFPPVPTMPLQELTKNPVVSDWNPAMQDQVKPVDPPPAQNKSDEATAQISKDTGPKDMQQIGVEDDAAQRPPLTIRPAETTDNVNSKAMVKSRMQAAQALSEEPVLDIAGKVPFRVLTIPERLPTRVKVEEHPPSITMVYLAGNSEIVVRQSMQNASMAAEVVDQQDQIVQFTRDNIVIEVTGNVDRAILEEFSKILQ